MQANLQMELPAARAVEVQAVELTNCLCHAFGSKEYSGVVDEISPTSNVGDIVFNISNARQQQTFNIKIRFDVTQYPELKNGMSAKLWIYK